LVWKRTGPCGKHRFKFFIDFLEIGKTPRKKKEKSNDTNQSSNDQTFFFENPS
jgi:hypothetical protein